MPAARKRKRVNFDVKIPVTDNHTEGVIGGLRLTDFLADEHTPVGKVWFTPIVRWTYPRSGKKSETRGNILSIPRDPKALRKIAAFLLDVADDAEADQLTKGTLDAEPD